MLMLCKKQNENLSTSVNLDWSPHEIAWADILHREIFEDGTYFKKVDINFDSYRNSKKKLRKIRDSSEEDEGFEDGTSDKPYVKMIQISSKDYLEQLNE